MTFPTADQATSERLTRLRKLDVCAVSDALDLLGHDGVTACVSPMWPVCHTVAGIARTVQAGARKAGGPTDHIAAAAVDSSGPAHVLVIANAGRKDVSCWGGLLAQAARRNGIAGVVIDGACRDLAETEALQFPIFARGAVPTSARGRIVQLAMDQPIDFGGIPVAGGDDVIADRTGVGFVHADLIERVLELAERVAEREAAMSEQVGAGRSVREVMHDSKFPTLATSEVAAHDR